MSQIRFEPRANLSRRQWLKTLLGAGLGARVSLATAVTETAPRAASGPSSGQSPGPPAGVQLRSAIRRSIPRSGESLFAVGLGTYRTFDVGPDAEARARLREVLQLFVKYGGRVIDSSPMYGQAETVVGDLSAEIKARGSLFLATKVWTEGAAAGIQQMETSMQRLRTKQLDLIQVHNLVDWRAHWQTLRAWKEQGRVRYIGITHYTSSAYDALEQVMRQEKPDFVQLNYSIESRRAERRLLPLASELGIAVLVNRPFEQAGLFGKVRGSALPAWAAEFDCASWAQYFLKFILAHPAVTCVIPATGNPKHLVDNMHAGFGRLPDAATREKMAEFVRSV